MKTKLTFLFILICSCIFSQKGKISGFIYDKEKNIIPNATIYFDSIEKIIYSNTEGFYNSPKIKFGKYTVHYYMFGYEKKIVDITIDSIQNKIQNIYLNQLNYELEEYEFTDKKEFNIRKLRAIEGVMITQGKKTEAINLAKTNANKAVNLSRQIYAKIPGLNIWESDGAGLQLGLGGRGLNPNRNSNFNTRQNGYDISADALGYPESYYSPPSEAIEEIQFIRGAASLQFGPQFGGLINFKLKDGNPNKKIETTLRHSVGSFQLKNTFLSVGGKNKNWTYYGYGNYKLGNDWRENSNFNLKNGYIKLTNQFNDNGNISLEFTKMNYLAKQPGGLTDLLFEINSDTSLRTRNWFKVDWNLAAINLNYEFSSSTKINSRTFGLIASRKSLGYLDQINRADPMLERNLISGQFKNIGNETRLIHLYERRNLPWAFLIGTRIYKGNSIGIQGDASNGSDANFEFINSQNNISSDFIESDYNFPSYNYSLFAEHIFNVNKKLSITPGLRYENINTSSNGNYRIEYPDLAGNIIFDTIINENRNNNRDFLLFGIGFSYKFNSKIETYANISENYRSVNFADMQIRNPNFKIDPILKDERGFNSDIGIRGTIKNILYFDASLYYLYYNNRIGTTLETDTNLFNTYQYRTNISKSRTLGIESVLEINWTNLHKENLLHKISTFFNFAYNNAQYISSDEPAFYGKKVEMVPPIIFKSGINYSYRDLSISYQLSYNKEQYSDATNATFQNNAVVGIIPSYSIMDLSIQYQYKQFQIESGINNLTNEKYFTRRAVGYPGPGIIPSMPRNFYFCLQIKVG
ncbi:MAG: iron(III) dicitrate transport protein FecA [Crocinitomicaceae bacterium]|nr:iron(III) dicitrate transport protein FecA [Crocinitomicaceae bacterium]